MTIGIRGTSGDDNLGGTAGNDDFLLWQGGSDTVHAGDGNDIFRMGAALNAGDKLDGGVGTDAVVLNGDYSAGLVFNADTIANVEVLTLMGGHSYNLTLNDGNVAAGAALLVKAGGLGSGDSLIFDGSAETDGQFVVIGGAGNDTVTGGAQADRIHLENGGADSANGGGGNDTFYLGDSLWTDDHIDGGSGRDTVHVTGFGGGDGITFTSTTVQGVEDFVLDTTTALGITTDDATVAAGATMTFDASRVNGFYFDGSAESDGRFVVVGGAGDDDLTGGANSDVFHLERGGNDVANGGAGNDHFYLGATLTAADQIQGGTGFDTVLLVGGAAVTFGATTMTDVERIVLGAGHSYTFTMNDATIAAGETLTIDASALGAANRLALQGSAETDGSFDIIGGAGNEIVSGGANADSFHLENGGNDTANGGGGNDTFYMGGALTAADKINGGAGTDTVVLNGMGGDDAILFNATTLTNVEKLVLDPGHFYTLVTDDATVAAGQTLTIDGSNLGAGDPLEFNGSAETDGSFRIIAGAGNDVLTGGAGADVFHLENGGIDTVNGAGGNDHVYMGGSLTAADQIEGGAGYDTVILDGGAAVTFTATTMTGVEQIDLTAGHSYSLTTNDATVASSGFLTVDASALGAGDALTFDGSAETVGYFNIIGGAGNDVITGGQGGDIIDLSLGGNDTVTLGSTTGFFENDVYLGSALTAADHIDGSAGFDVVYLEGDYSGANAVVFNATTMVDIDFLELAPGFSYDLTTNDGNVSAGGVMEVDGFLLGAGDSLKFDGSAETDGSFILNDGLGNDVLKGGGGNDFLSFDGGGTDVGQGGGGNDYIDACGHFDSTDQFDGGTGTDTIELTASDTGSGNYTGPDALVLTAAMMSNIEVMLLDNGGSYDITTSDGNVAAGSSLTVDGSILGPSDSLTFDGSAETDGSFDFIAGASLVTHLKGGAGDDTFDLTGADPTADTQASGNGGSDTFYFLDNFDSSSQIIDGGAGTNTLSLDGDYSSISLVGSGIIDNIQTITFAGGHSYTGIQVFDDVAGGGTLTFDASALQSGDAFGLDASLSTDAIHLMAGDGSYTATGSAQDDTFDMGALFTAADAIDGGAGNDTLSLSGDYSAGITLAATTMTNVENMVLNAGNDYNITFDDGNIANGDALTVDTAALSGQIFTIDDSAETDGKMIVTAGAAFTASDTFIASSGSGGSLLVLDGDYSGGLTFGATTIQNVQEIELGGGHSYSLTTDDANVASGASLTVDASALTGSDILIFDGSVESDGTFTFDVDSAQVLANSQIAGGAGSDTLVLNGDFTAGGGVSFGSSTVQNIEAIQLADGHSYSLGLNGNTVATGQSITVDGSALTGSNAMLLSFDTTGGGDSTYIYKGGAGDDVFTMLDAFTASDQLDGGTGSDEVSLNGDYSAGITLNDSTITNIDFLLLINGHSYNLTMADGNVAAGQTLNVLANGLAAGETVTFDGSAETDGSFLISTGAGDDILTGGAQADTFDLTHGGSDTVTGLGGGDAITANAGSADTFVFTAVSDSSSINHDTITNVDFGTDRFEMSSLAPLPSAIDTAITTGHLDAATFDSDLSSDVFAGNLGAGHAVLFTADSGDFSGHTFLIVDINFIAGYQNGSDLVIDVTGFTGSLTTADFI